MELKYIKKIDDNYITLKQVLKEEFKFSSRLILKLKNDKRIHLNNEITYLNKELTENDEIIANLDFEEDNSNIVPTKMNLEILYEDECFLIVNKPAGIPVHPSLNHYTDSLSNGVKYYYDSINLHKLLRPINRLDLYTSGIVLFAKNEYIQEYISNEMANNIFQKQYITLVNGIFDKSEGTINEPIARANNSIIERCVSPTGKKSITHYKVLKSSNNITKLLVKLETGRTHQIRVHMSYIGHSIIGDTLYGTESNLINRQALHAYQVNFVHPVIKKEIKIIAPIPYDMQQIINLL